jgi:hypothetical protein
VGETKTKSVDVKEKFDSFGDADNEFSDDTNDFSAKENEAPVVDDENDKLPVTVKLKRPFKFGKIEYTEIVFKFPITVGMMKAMPASEEYQKVGHQLPLISGMTGEPSSVIEMLSPADFGQCTKVVTRFL